MISLKEYIINEAFDDLLKLNYKDKQKLLDLDLEYGKVMLIARYETTVREVSNIDEEFQKFKKSFIDNNKKYFPILKYKELEYEKYNLEKRVINLRSEFLKLNCYVSKYYIDNLDDIIKKITYLKSFKDKNFKNPSVKIEKFNDDLIEQALHIVNTTKFENPKDDIFKRTISADEAAKIIKKTLNELNYDWNIIMKDDMLPRMGVNPEKTFRIKSSAEFSKVDIDSLIAHEIKAHVAKRYYGYQTGLFLFVFGLNGKNFFDEGLAIWNTFNLIKTQKPNALYKIALSYISSYYCANFDFCDAFVKIKELVNDNFSDKYIFNILIRSKRSVIDTKQLGFWSGDIDYFGGYMAVKNMTDAERDIILKNNIGRSQIYDVDTINKFLSLNKFKPIDNDRLENIKKDYIFKS